MILIGKNKLIKFGKKARGNKILNQNIADIIKLIENKNNNCKDEKEFKELLKSYDPDNVSRGYNAFFLNISKADRSLVVVEYDEIEGEVDVLFVGTHDEYETTFKNNKDVIEKYLKDRLD